jgi:hypothetical protein
MESLSYDQLYAHMKFMFDLASGALATPVAILFLVGAIFLIWRVLSPRR